MVSFMKKVLIVCLVFLLLYGVYRVRNNKVVSVSLETNTFFNLDDYNVFYLSLEEENISTLNLKNILSSDITIISITPYINPIYADKISSLKYKFENISYKRNITNFTKYYINSIEEHGYNDDLSYINVNGIKINEIEVYAKGSDIVNMIYVKPKIKYKNFLNSDYNYLSFSN